VPQPKIASPEIPTPPEEEDVGAVTRSGENEAVDNWSWEKVLCSDPEMLIRNASRHSDEEEESPLAAANRAADERRQAESLRNPTAAMKAIMRKMEERERVRQTMSWQQQLQHLTSKNRAVNGNGKYEVKPNPMTPAMEEVMRMRANRISLDLDAPITPDPSDPEDEGDEDDDDSSDDENVFYSVPDEEEVDDVDEDNDNDDEDVLYSFPDYEEAGPSGTSEKQVSSRSLKSLSKRSSLRLATPVKRKALFDGKGEEMSALDGGLELDDELLQLLREEGVSVAQQRQALQRFKAATPAITRAKTALIFKRDDDEDQVPAGVNKRRRISVQNDASPIRNKNSPPEAVIRAISSMPDVKSKGKTTGERWVTGVKLVKRSELDVIPESASNAPPAKVNMRRRRTADSPSNASKAKKVSLKRSSSRRGSPEPQAASKRGKKAEKAPRSPKRPKKRAKPSSSSSAMPRRRMRPRCETSSGGGWNWEQILLSDPDKVAKRRK